jgi:hypothetical protein
VEGAVTLITGVVNSLDNGDRVRAIDVSRKTSLPIDTGQAIPFAPAWIDDAPFVTSGRDTTATTVAGAWRVLVAPQGALGVFGATMTSRGPKDRQPICHEPPEVFLRFFATPYSEGGPPS